MAATEMSGDLVKEYVVFIDSHVIRTRETITVMARNFEDAEYIGRALFERGHTPECIIDEVKAELK